MSGHRHDGWGKRAGKSLLVASLLASAAALFGSAGGCSIGLTGASIAADDPADASVPVRAVDAGSGAADAGRRKAVAPAADAATLVSLDAGTVGVVSPLCGVVVGDGSVTCDPDEGSCSVDDAGADASTVPSADAGAYEAVDGGGDVASGAAGGRSACHVTAVYGDGGVTGAAGSTPVAPTCSAAGNGTEESACSASSDCAPGLDCVVADGSRPDGAALLGVCRRYCCNNVCGGTTASYCHIQPTIGGAVAVPVCVPTAPHTAADGGAPCTLLDDSTCGAGLTCQVVNVSSGQLACVTAGTATAGQSCDVMNCAAGLSCLAGTFPYRTCAQLCDQEYDQCPAGQTCMSNPVLSSVDAQIGVCTP